jgi:hypothetical protein
MNLASLCVICVQGWHGAAAPEIEKTRRHSRVGGATGVRSSFGRLRLSADRLRLRYRLNRLAYVASRWRLRFLWAYAASISSRFPPGPIGGIMGVCPSSTRAATVDTIKAAIVLTI